MPLIASVPASLRRVAPCSSPIGTGDALSENVVATLVRLRGKRRLVRFAGRVGGSNVAFRGIKPDPATAIQAAGSDLQTGGRSGIAR
jgi:hypothetical protein